MYVACTRARERLMLFVPSSLYQRGEGGNQPAAPSPFVRELPAALYEEWYESYTGGLQRRDTSRPVARPAVASTFGCAPRPESAPVPGGPSPVAGAAKLGFCTHKIFGRGKIVQHLPPDKYRVNFPGVGLKVILGDYLTLEDDA